MIRQSWMSPLFALSAVRFSDGGGHATMRHNGTGALIEFNDPADIDAVVRDIAVEVGWDETPQGNRRFEAYCLSWFDIYHPAQRPAG